ncbi:MAG: TonB-dependent receptor [Acidobacteriota bacterium]
MTAFELGTKNTLAGNRARINAVAFYYDYENYQFVQEDPVPFAGGTGNVPTIGIYGLETEFSWLIDDHWRLDGQATLADGDVTSDLFVLDTVDFLNSGFGRFLPTGVSDRASLRQNLRGNTPPKLVEQSLRSLSATLGPWPKATSSPRASSTSTEASSSTESTTTPRLTQYLPMTWSTSSSSSTSATSPSPRA